MKTIWLNVLLILLTFNSVLKANPELPDNIQTTHIEITDKYNEVKLGINDQSVYMLFTEYAREVVNKEFENKHWLDKQSFSDSEGNFIIGNTQFLRSNRIEISIKDIERVTFKNGVLNFEYNNSQELAFDDIQSFNGTNVLQNFYVEDLERFVITFREVKK